MNIKYVGNILSIDDCRICYKNFSGAKSMYNLEGDRNFHVIIDNDADAQMLRNDGWNVKIREPRNDGEDVFRTLPVKLRFNDRGPRIYLVTNGKQTLLDEDGVGIIDTIDIERIDMDVRPYDWEMKGTGRTGRTAYVNAMRVVQRLDRFASYDAYLGMNVDDDDLPM